MLSLIEAWVALRLLSQTNPTSVDVGQLGIAGVCVAIAGAGWYFERQANRELRAVIATEHVNKEAWIGAQTRANDLILNATTALAASAQAMDKVAESLARVPGEDTFVRLTVALERVERTERPGGRNAPPTQK